MILEALKYILELHTPVVREVHGLQYSGNSRDGLKAIKPPLFEPVNVRTLQGLADLLEAGVEGAGAATVGAAVKSLVPAGGNDLMIVVDDHLTVRVVSRVSERYGRRAELVVAKCDDTISFRFGQFLAPEEFVIGLLSCFVPTSGDHANLVRVASNLKAEAVATSEDDGMSQTATVRKGVTLANRESIKGRVTLAPFRTFREAEQPASEFVFRLRSAGPDQPPMCALFEADGGTWKSDAMQNVKTWLVTEVKGYPVIA